MELKHKSCEYNNNNIDLLIVPYGIETESSIIFRCRASLLIVPYGIETTK